MNKTLLILIAGIVIVGGLIGYTVLGKSESNRHTDGDGHTTNQHKAMEGHMEGDAHTDVAHDQMMGTAPHDDTGTTPHND